MRRLDDMIFDAENERTGRTQRNVSNRKHRQVKIIQGDSAIGFRLAATEEENHQSRRVGTGWASVLKSKLEAGGYTA